MCCIDQCTFNNLVSRVTTLERNYFLLQQQVNGMNSSYKKLAPLFIHGTDFDINHDYHNTLYNGLNNYSVYYNGVKFLKPGVDFNYITDIPGGIHLLMAYDGADEFLLIA